MELRFLFDGGVLKRSFISETFINYGCFKNDMKTTEILSALFDDKTVRVLDKLLDKKGIFYLRELSKEADVSLATTYRIVQRLLDMGLVEKQMRDKFTYYNIKTNSPMFDELCGLLRGKKAEPLEVFKEKIKNMGVSVYVTKTNQLFVVGDTISGELKPALDELNAGGKKYKHMVIKEDQFKQMAELGLIDKARQIV